MIPVVFGTGGRNKTITSGTFYCPTCNSEQEFNHKKAKKYFTLYFVPLIPLEEGGEFIECKNCKSTFNLNVLQYRPSLGKEEFLSEYKIAFKKLVIMMALADGRIHENEIRGISDIYSGLIGRKVSLEEVEKEIQLVKNEGLTIQEYLKKIAPYLNDFGKESIIKNVFLISLADGYVDESEKKLMIEIATSLGISPAHYKGIINSIYQEMKEANQKNILMCPKCKNETPNDSDFCQFCGFNISENSPPNKFEENCNEIISFVISELKKGKTEAQITKTLENLGMKKEYAKDFIVMGAAEYKKQNV
ncbi:MAG TPA: zinc-ribbon domain-containing protein [Methanofastidiosum sp.]|nr:zinc-ribbon domain-containing protein [Methanofastidiosum sp.]HNU62049.1 zinc-ribbon domain-containing protein [Methanofastidiosum sp.]